MTATATPSASGKSIKLMKSVARHYGDLNPKTFEACGGDSGVHALASSFYNNVFKDPILAPLFEKKLYYHAQRLAWLIMHFMEVSDEYMKNRRGMGTIGTMHRKSQCLVARAEGPPGCGCPGGQFTTSQRDAWKGHFMTACREVAGMNGGLLQDMEDFVDRPMRFYGPFVADRSEDKLRIGKIKDHIGSDTTLYIEA